VPRHRPQDHFGRRAKSQGYPARSVYKLEEIDRRMKLFKAGQRVLDLGAAPGSFSLYAADRVGPNGVVVGVDLQEIRIAAPKQVRFIQCDIAEFDPSTLGIDAFDVVLSDMAPHTSGQRHRDQFLSFELYMQALCVSAAMLAKGGYFVGKIFQGPELEQARAQTRELLGNVKIVKPEASRSESFEIFLASGPRSTSPAAPAAPPATSKS
jgi:23S rRNA (uridine2552-2'-O)-methyltransferase